MEAALLQKHYGYNEIKAQGIGVFEIIFRQFNSPFFYLLFIAGLVSFFIGEKPTALLFFISVGINIILGFIQEFKAERSISLLKKLIPQRATVLRDGKLGILLKKVFGSGRYGSAFRRRYCSAE